MTDTLQSVQQAGTLVNRDDVFIAVMGLSGTGKSSLIASCTGENVIVGDDLQSCTRAVTIFSYDFVDGAGHTSRVHFVDTPGFNDDQQSDVETLQQTAFWLSQAFDNGFLLDGIIYLHNITTPRFNEASRRSLAILKSLCGEKNFKAVYLASTFWDEAAAMGSVALSQAYERHEQLVSKYWKDLIAKGAQSRSAPNVAAPDIKHKPYDWVQPIVGAIISKATKHILQIQAEMKHPKANLSNTSAAKTAGEIWRLDERRKAYLPLLDRSKEELNAAWTRTVVEDMERLQEQIAELEVEVQRTKEDSRRRAKQEQLETLEKAKDRAIASRSFWMNTAATTFGAGSMVVGTVSAAVAVLPLLAMCTLM